MLALSARRLSQLPSVMLGEGCGVGLRGGSMVELEAEVGLSKTSSLKGK